MLVSTILGRFVIPIYYVLGERLIRYFSGPNSRDEPEPLDDGHQVDPSWESPHAGDALGA